MFGCALSLWLGNAASRASARAHLTPLLRRPGPCESGKAEKARLKAEAAAAAAKAKAEKGEKQKKVSLASQQEH